MTALGKNCIAGVKFETRFIGRFLLATGINPHIAGGDTLDAVVILIKNFGRRKTGKNFGTQLNCLFSQPTTQIAQGDDVVAVVVHRPWQQQSRKAKRCPGSGEKIDIVTGDSGIQRCASFFPIREKLIQRGRLEYRTGQDMGANFGAFLQYAN